MRSGWNLYFPPLLCPRQYLGDYLLVTFCLWTVHDSGRSPCLTGYRSSFDSVVYEVVWNGGRRQRTLYKVTSLGWSSVSRFLRHLRQGSVIVCPLSILTCITNLGLSRRVYCCLLSGVLRS